MKKTLLACAAFALLTGGAFAEEKAKAPQLAEKTGVVEVVKADPARNEKYNTVLLKAGEETVKLLPAQDKKKEFGGLEKLAGKTVTVSGEFLSAKPPKYPLAAIKVSAFAEAKPAKPARK